MHLAYLLEPRLCTIIFSLLVPFIPAYLLLPFRLLLLRLALLAPLCSVLCGTPLILGLGILLYLLHSFDFSLLLVRRQNTPLTDNLSLGISGGTGVNQRLRDIMSSFPSIVREAAVH